MLIVLLAFYYLLQRNGKREVDNTKKMYLIDTTLENLSHVTDYITNALFLFIEKTNSQQGQQGKQNYRNSYLKTQSSFMHELKLINKIELFFFLICCL